MADTAEIQIDLPGFEELVAKLNAIDAKLGTMGKTAEKTSEKVDDFSKKLTKGLAADVVLDNLGRVGEAMMRVGGESEALGRAMKSAEIVAKGFLLGGPAGGAAAVLAESIRWVTDAWEEDAKMAAYAAKATQDSLAAARTEVAKYAEEVGKLREQQRAIAQTTATKSYEEALAGITKEQAEKSLERTKDGLATIRRNLEQYRKELDEAKGGLYDRAIIDDEDATARAQARVDAVQKSIDDAKRIEAQYLEDQKVAQTRLLRDTVAEETTVQKDRREKAIENAKKLREMEIDNAAKAVAGRLQQWEKENKERLDRYQKFLEDEHQSDLRAAQIDDEQQRKQDEADAEAQRLRFRAQTALEKEQQSERDAAFEAKRRATLDAKDVKEHRAEFGKFLEQQLAAEEVSRSFVANAIAASQAGASAIASLGSAIIQTTQQKLTALGTEAAVQALMETGAGFAALANPFAAISAGEHFLSAAKYGAAAIAAGVGSVAVGSLATPAAAPAPRGGDSSTGTRGSSSSDSGGGGGGGTIIIQTGQVLATEADVRRSIDTARKKLERTR